MLKICFFDRLKFTKIGVNDALHFLLNLPFVAKDIFLFCYFSLFEAKCTYHEATLQANVVLIYDLLVNLFTTRRSRLL